MWRIDLLHTGDFQFRIFLVFCFVLLTEYPGNIFKYQKNKEEKTKPGRRNK